MSPPEPSHPITESPEYSNIMEEKEDNLKINFMMMIEVLKKEMSKSLKEIKQTKKKLDEINNLLKNVNKTVERSE